MWGEIDLDAYLERIGYEGPREPTLPTLSAIHLRHPSSIPFESVDPLLGRGVRIDAASLEAKLVRGGRGGYCFENNGVLLRALLALGFEVTPLAARVRWMLAGDAPPTALSHMALKVALPQGDYLADVGFGGQSPTAPLRLQAGPEQATPHGTYRLVEAEGGYELQMRLSDRWAAMYRFRDEAQAPRDYEVFNWFTATHPQGRFTNNLAASRVVGERRLNLENAVLTVHGPDGMQERAIQGPAELHALLTGDFGLRLDRADADALWARLPKAAETA